MKQSSLRALVLITASAIIGACDENAPPTATPATVAPQLSAPAPARSVDLPQNAQKSVAELVKWTKANRAHPDKAVAEAECYKPGDSDAGWCDGFHNVPGMTSGMLLARYWRADPKAARFELSSVSGRVQCTHIGTTSGSASRQAGSKLRLVRCDMTGELDGMVALINQSPGQSTVFLMTPTYRDRDKKIKMP